ncbi:MAG: 16S rRNA (adenine(1518)-N(6)/adenine(1519)-N(6))-dimethyltransferase RsmA [Alphaproteobacteria bacterium]|nr:16S rRNA (adenine(1518)-N(6)/adenine(1519)-N(6))-dimethyltransferase RsmA [Alphaproteobacteria bacterium]
MTTPPERKKNLLPSSPLPPLREIIGRYKLAAKKSLGQNFLLDLNLTAKIAHAAGDLTDKNVIEIGPGPGGLTRALLETEAKHIYAVERDDRCLLALQEIVAAYPDRLTIEAGDAIKLDVTSLCPAPRVLIANLPYNIATPLLIGWLKKITEFDSLTLMFQREVADRLTAKPRTKEYGRLSIIAQWLAIVEKKFDIPPSAFTPQPKVTSTVVHIVPRQNRKDNVEFALMEKVTASAFGQRRKMLRQSLKKLGTDTEKLLAAADLAPTARAEEIDSAGFIRLAEAYQNTLIS